MICTAGTDAGFVKIRGQVSLYCMGSCETRTMIFGETELGCKKRVISLSHEGFCPRGCVYGITSKGGVTDIAQN